MKIHLDTDIGGDIDDLCALAMVLRWPGAELTGVTTVAEHAWDGSLGVDTQRAAHRSAPTESNPINALLWCAICWGWRGGRTSR